LNSLWLGFDLSTQQLKGVVIDSDLEVVHEAKFDFDSDSMGYGTEKWLIANSEAHEIHIHQSYCVWRCHGARGFGLLAEQLVQCCLSQLSAKTTGVTPCVCEGRR
jgi:hypothetical protein